jgi:hypothetical protein
MIRQSATFLAAQHSLAPHQSHSAARWVSEISLWPIVRRNLAPALSTAAAGIAPVHATSITVTPTGTDKLGTFVLNRVANH